MHLREITDKSAWDKLVIDNGGHPLQLWGWGEVKSKEGIWKAHRLWADGCGGAQILVRKLPKPFTKLAYIPRGPIFYQKNLSQEFLTKLTDWAKKQGCIELKIEVGELAHEKNASGKITLRANESNCSGIFKKNNGWRLSKNPVLLNKTVALDLAKSEGELLKEMSKKTRQYINKSSRENISVRRVKTENDLKKCLEIYKSTAQRAKFNLHPDDYYLSIAKFMGEQSQVYVAEKDKKILSFLWIVATPEISFELYGGVTDEGQRLRANYALKWRMIQECKQFHVKYYDMNGLLNDGVSNFKLGFSGNKETVLIPTFDKPLSPLYAVWESLLPAGKKIVRLIKKG
ncbi:aminoacyltransferase [Candidatus Saccharibacteria bacterium]|jgi:lipid II:glycine glycyltransferase (peptidoglycan interpeptide bridge formation enzyme)|nr:aminoacyltransferase [Candidatus Saccharibacteria bacterium]